MKEQVKELTDQTRFYFNHQKRREDMNDVATESQDRMINAVFYLLFPREFGRIGALTNQ